MLTLHENVVKTIIGQVWSGRLCSSSSRKLVLAMGSDTLKLGR